MIPSRRLAIICIGTCVMVTGLGCSPPSTKSRQYIMNKFRFQTYPVGRHLIDMPDSVVDVKRYQRILSVDVAWISASKEQFDWVLAERRRALKPSSNTATLLIEDSPGPRADTRILIFEKRDARDGQLGYEAYRYFSETNGYYLLAESAERERVAIVKPWVGRVLSMLAPRSNEVIPKMQGSCIDHGLITNAETDLNDIISITAKLGNATIWFSTRVNDRIEEGPSLMERTLISGAFSDVKVLRRAQRSIGVHDGEEFVFSEPPSNVLSTTFSAEWEAPGKLRSLDLPNLRASIVVQGERIAESLEDEELLGLWDVILGSIRLRPGSV